MIRFDDVTIKYGVKTACKDVTFSAENGEITVLLGKNGSGKTSLLKAAVGILPYEGHIEKDGELGYMPQELPRVELTVTELVQCSKIRAGHPLKKLSEKDKENCREIIAKTGLSKYADTKICELSGGECQRAYFAMLIGRDANTIILDEPTANLDSEYRQMVYDFARQFKEEGRAVLMVLHHTGEAKRIADKIVEMP